VGLSGVFLAIVEVIGRQADISIKQHVLSADENPVRAVFIGGFYVI
jgi:hypothetical protein